MRVTDKWPQVIIIGRDDKPHQLFNIPLREAGLHLYKVLEPKNEIDWLQVEQADIIITDLEELNYGFEHCELLATVLKLYPNKIVVGETEEYEPETSKIVKDMGATGYIYRNEVGEILAAALAKMVKGKKVFLGLPSYKQN